VKLHYALYNEDKTETVLLLHGLGSSGADWELQLPALRDHYRVLAPDARGHGRSPKPRARYFIPEMVEDVVALLDDLHIQSAQVVGLSMGGAMAQQLALAHPERVESLVLVNTFARVRPAGWNGLFRFFSRVYALQFAGMPQLGEPVIARMFPKPDQAEIRRIGLERFVAYNTDKEVYKSLLRANIQFDVRKQLANIHCPTLIVTADRDLTVPMRCKVELRDQIHAAEFAVIPDSGHATPIDQSEPFNKVLLAFLARHQPVPIS
jgi:pimeloyl-ACP methyl ester carboxylesterase